MRNELKIFSDLYTQNDRFREELDQYTRMISSTDFEFFKNCLLTLKGAILSDVFSRSFTELDQTEKDVEQRVYYKLNQWLDFFVNPRKWMEQKKSLQTRLTGSEAVPSKPGKE